MNPEHAGSSAATGSYVHANAAFDDELARLHLLEARYDPRTFRRLSMFGPLAGARCLEVGAGTGSVARWLAGGVAGQEELDAVAAATADASFSFVDALSVAAWGRPSRRAR